MVGNLAVKGNLTGYFVGRIKLGNKLVPHLLFVVVSVKEKAFSVGKQSAAKTEHFNAAFFVRIGKSDYVLLANRRFNNLLLFAHGFKCVYAVAELCGPFKFEVFGGVVHLRR